MCGIVGFTGNKQAAPILLDGLSKLEYRGYDSAGREDCAYFAYQATCSKCHQFKNIVVGVKLNKRLFAHNEFR